MDERMGTQKHEKKNKKKNDERTDSQIVRESERMRRTRNRARLSVKSQRDDLFFFF